jgi:hypothetical protein
LLLAAVFCGSCSPEGPNETRLVSRVFQDADFTCDDQAVCRFEFPGETFRVADGRTATTEPSDVEWVLERLARGEVECGDELIQTDAGWRLLDAKPDQRRDALVFDDGSAVDLFLESWVVIIDTCSESVGRWEGVAGTFEGRSGTYRWTRNLVQVEIVLTDS